jgi:glycosyltransferase involved in cell wall biosynthesis
MRILVFGDVPPFVVGGAEMQTWRLARQWRARGHEVHIAGHRIVEGTRDGIALFHLPVIRRAGRAIRGLSFFVALALFWVRRRLHYDLIYCRFLGEATLSVAFLKQLGVLNVPLVAVPAAGGEEDNADAALLRALPATQTLVTLLNRQCDCINFIAPGVARAVQKIGLQPKRSAYIPNGVPMSQCIAQGPRESAHRLVFVGRLVYQKGLDLLFPCLTRLKKEGLHFQLTVVGDGELRPGLEKLAQALGIEGQVRFMGEQPQDVVAEELARADFFVLPSRYEGLSNAALEALACGLPCLLSRCGGLDTFLTKETGWVFDAHDPEEMGSVLGEALRIAPARWRAMSGACRELVRTQFSLEAIADRNITIFEELVSENKTYRMER